MISLAPNLRLASLFLIWTINPLLSFSQHHLFQNFGKAEGLSDKVSNALVQDHDGYLWIATNHGLTRYDGYEFKRFEPDPEDPNSITEGFLSSLMVDRRNNLWIGAWTGDGLYRLSPDRRQFTRFFHDPEDPGTISGNGVQCMFEDAEGTLWFGGSSGLNRYLPEMETFERIQPSLEDTLNSLSHMYVMSFLEDSAGAFWVGTANGLNLFDREKETFRHFYLPANDPDDPVHTAITSLFEDSEDGMWVGSNNGGLFSFDRESERFTYYPYDPAHPEKLSGLPGLGGRVSGGVPSITEDSRGRLWVGSVNGGLLSYDPATGKATRFFHDPGQATSLGSDQVMAILETHDGNLWFSTWGGLSKLPAEVNGYSVVWTAEDSQNMVWAVAEDQWGRLWIGTEKGLWMTDRRAGENKEYLPGIHIAKLLKDRDGKIWAFTSDARLFRYRVDGNYFQIVTWRNADLPSPDIYAIDIDKQNNLWMQTTDGKLLRYRLEDGRLDTIFHLPRFSEAFYRQLDALDREGKSLAWIASMDLTKHGSGQGKTFDIQRPTSVLVYCMGPIKRNLNKEVISFDLSRTNGERIWHSDPAKSRHAGGLDMGLRAQVYLDTLPPGSYQVTERVSGFHWAMGQWPKSPPDHPHREGVQVYDISGREQLFQDLIRQKPEQLLPGNFLYQIHIPGNSGEVWVATDKGFFKDDPVSDQFTVYSEDINPGRPMSFVIPPGQGGYGYVIHNNISGVFLKQFDDEARASARINDELLRTPVAVPLTDDAGRLWMITVDNRFLVYNPETRKLKYLEGISSIYPYGDTAKSEIFHQIDPIHPEGAWTAGCKTAAGELIFGGRGGVIALQPDLIMEDKSPWVSLTMLKILDREIVPGKDRVLERPLSQTKQLRLSHRQNDLTIGYKGIHFSDGEKVTYAYRLSPYEKDWREVGAIQQAVYPNLPSGNYTFQVKAANSNGFWSEPPALSIIVRPPWWAAWWAFVLYAILAGGIVIGIYHFQLSRRLAEAEARRLRELDAFKTQMYTDITHEFRSPLTVMLGMADKMSKDPENWFRQGVEMIRRNGRRLLHLVDQMLDLRKLESGAVPLHLKQGNVVPFLQQISETFAHHADSKDIRLHFLADEPEIVMDYDPDKLQKIVSNLLSNAIKFTPAGGDVYFSVCYDASAERTPSALRTLSIKIKDTGPGIPEDKVPYIFDRFYQAPAPPNLPEGGGFQVDSRSGLKSSSPLEQPSARHSPPSGEQGGSGIGLALTKELVVLLGGEIQVKSRMNRGTEFMVRLPINCHAPLAMEVSTAERTRSAFSTGNNRDDHPLALIVEDDEDIARYISSCLEQEYRIETAGDGRLGIEKALASIPDIIITDVIMPEADGFELCRTLKEDRRTSHIPIIVLTAKADEASKLEGLETGADAYLFKPFKEEELYIRVWKLIELRRRLQLRYSTYHPAPATGENRDPEERFLDDVRKALDEHLGEESFGIAQLCRALRLSRMQLHRKLKALTGLSASYFIRNHRLDRASELLEKEALNISEVAYEVGFGSPSYFTKSFRERFGVSPKHYRNSLKKRN